MVSNSRIVAMTLGPLRDRPAAISADGKADKFRLMPSETGAFEELVVGRLKDAVSGQMLRVEATCNAISIS
jgi:hypothetical protein